MYQILCSEQGQMLPNVPHKLFWGDSMYQILSAEQGETLPNFSPRTFWVWFEVSNCMFRTGVNTAQFFAMSFLESFDVPSFMFLPSFMFWAGGNAAQFLAMSFLESFDVSKVVFRTRGKCCPIFFCGVIQCIKNCVRNRGKCCPIFCHEFFGAIRLSNFVFSTGGNAANIFPQNFWGDSMHQILCLERGEMLPNFSPRTFAGWFDVSKIVFGTGGNAAQIFAMSFLESFDYQFLCLEQGEMLSNFSPRTFWSHSMHQILCLEMLPNFCPRTFWGWFEVSNVVFRTGGNAARFFAMSFLESFDVSNFAFRTGGNAVQFCPTNSFGVIRCIKFYV